MIKYIINQNEIWVLKLIFRFFNKSLFEGFLIYLKFFIMFNF